MTLAQPLPTTDPHLPELIARYQRQTQESRRLAAACRDIVADKSSIGQEFNAATREIAYPIAVAKALGAYLWDVDGNRYTDILQGLGINLFGHNPAFVREAIAAQLIDGFPIGPQSPLVGEVATLIRELTGVQRVAFSNTGTEAIMTAIRIARTATRRSRIVIFTHSYHGHADAVLMRAPLVEYARKKLLSRLREHPWTGLFSHWLERAVSSGAVPAFPGVSAATAQEVTVLEYGHPRSLEIIRAQRKHLAAVLVEPVQSRFTELQPVDFLHQLRELTAAAGIALIFDEMVTGFRIAAGGAQAYFGLSADIVTYSKIVGGGLPLSIVAGTADYLDHIDGGAQRFRNHPTIPTTFFAGTFTKHPLALAAAKATLTQIKTAGPGLYARLNERTAYLVERLNAALANRHLPIEFTCFGSFFTVASSRSQWSPLAQRLLSYHLLNRGLHLRIGDKGGFLSTAHTDQDVDDIVRAFDESFAALKQAAIL